MVDATAEAAGKVLYIFAFPSSEEWREQVWTFVGIFSDPSSAKVDLTRITDTKDGSCLKIVNQITRKLFKKLH